MAEKTKILRTPNLDWLVFPDRNLWVICGGESGAGCRPMEIEWALDLRYQCGVANVPFFMKQLGGHPNKRHDLTDFPEALQVREFPTPRKIEGREQ